MSVQPTDARAKPTCDNLVFVMRPKVTGGLQICWYVIEMCDQGRYCVHPLSDRRKIEFIFASEAHIVDTRPACPDSVFISGSAELEKDGRFPTVRLLNVKTGLESEVPLTHLVKEIPQSPVVTTGQTGSVAETGWPVMPIQAMLMRKTW